MFIYVINCGISLDDFNGFLFHIFGKRVGDKEGIEWGIQQDGFEYHSEDFPKDRCA